MELEELAISRVHGPLYGRKGASERWLVSANVPAGAFQELLSVAVHFVAHRPYAAALRVYGETPKSEHVVQLDAPVEAVTMLTRCEGVAIFDGPDRADVRHRVGAALADLDSDEEDEAIVCRVLAPGSVVFIHNGHNGVDVVCQLEEAKRFVSLLLGVIS